MRKKAVEELVDTTVDPESLSVEEQLDVIAEALYTLADKLEEQGYAPEIVSGALFRTFAERMCDANDRETYEEVLEEALEAEWDEVTIH